MNTKRIIFSGIVTSIIGTGLGVVILHLAPCPYKAKIYQGLKSQYAVIGGVAGLLFGASQEAVRQLKQQGDREEAIATQRQQLKSLVSRDYLD